LVAGGENGVVENAAAENVRAVQECRGAAAELKRLDVGRNSIYVGSHGVAHHQHIASIVELC
jgi:hypothetical protein